MIINKIVFDRSKNGYITIYDEQEKEIYKGVASGALILEAGKSNSYLTLLSVGAEHPATIEKVFDIDELDELLY